MVIGYMSETLTYASVAPSDSERSSTSETEGSVKEIKSEPDLDKEIDSELTRKEPIQPKSCCDCFTFWICKCLDSIGYAF